MAADIVDSLAFAGHSKFGGGESMERVLERSMAGGASTTLMTPAMPSDGNLVRANRILADSIARRDDEANRVHPIYRVDPYFPNVVEETRANWRECNRGIFIHSWEQTVRVTDRHIMDPVADLARELSCPLVIDSGFPWLSSPVQIGIVARRYRDVSIIATHGSNMDMSGLSLDAAGAALADNPNLHFLTGGIYRQDWLSQIAAAHPNRVMYASMSPIFDSRLEVFRVTSLDVEHDLARQLLSANARRVFNLCGGR